MLAVEPPGQLPGACDPAAELDLAQMGSDNDALAGLDSGIDFAWQEIQQLMGGATDEPLSDSLLDSLRDAFVRAYPKQSTCVLPCTADNMPAFPKV